MHASMSINANKLNYCNLLLPHVIYCLWPRQLKRIRLFFTYNFKHPTHDQTSISPQVKLSWISNELSALSHILCLQCQPKGKLLQWKIARKSGWSCSVLKSTCEACYFTALEDLWVQKGKCRCGEWIRLRDLILRLRVFLHVYLVLIGPYQWMMWYFVAFGLVWFQTGKISSRLKCTLQPITRQVCCKPRDNTLFGCFLWSMYVRGRQCIHISARTWITGKVGICS